MEISTTVAEALEIVRDTPAMLLLRRPLDIHLGEDLLDLILTCVKSGGIAVVSARSDQIKRVISHLNGRQFEIQTALVQRHLIAAHYIPTGVRQSDNLEIAMSKLRRPTIVTPIHDHSLAKPALEPLSLDVVRSKKIRGSCADMGNWRPRKSAGTVIPFRK